MSQKKGAFEKQNNKTLKLKLNPIMKKVLVFLSVLFIITICLLLCCNYIENKTLKNNSISKVPFANTLYFCPVKSNIHNLNYKKGTMLLLSKEKNYNTGEKIFIKNNYPNKQNATINKKYLVGIIKQVENKDYSVLISSEEIVKIQENDIIAKVNSGIYFVGNIYNNMIGVQGYIFFGVIPFLFIVLIYFIMRYITISKCLKENNQKPLTNEEPLKIVSQTIRSVPKPKSLYIIDCEEDVKLYKSENQKNQEQNTNQIENSDSKKETIEEKQPVITNLKENEIKKIREKSFTIIKKIKLQENFKKVTESNILTYNKQENIEDKEDEKTTKKQEINYLTVDEIIAQYRKEKPENVEDEKEADEKLNHIAKFYYDNNIENYQ